MATKEEEGAMLVMDLTTVSIAIGLVVSLLFTELFGLTAGGMVVPGYLALSLDEPASVVLTLAAAITTFFIVKGISKVAIVYGRRRIVLMILFGFIIGGLIRAVPVAAATMSSAPEMIGGHDASVIGFIIPGLIALWFDRQGIVETVSILLTTSIVVRLSLILLGLEVPA
jgi:poly-gamma-glutamate biosynthesis protein PgsC/CapC